jgi:hypothetical protein
MERGSVSPARIGDSIVLEKAIMLPDEFEAIVGSGFWELFDESHRCRSCQVGLPCERGGKGCRPKELIDAGEFTNLVTQIGDQYYGERAAGIASPPAQVTGMQLGTGATAAAKTGAGAAVVTYVAGSNVAIDGGFPTSALNGASRRIAWKTTWPAGTATTNGLNEVVIINQAIATNAAAPAANTISRALLAPVVNKGANDSLAVTWNHDLLGA